MEHIVNVRYVTVNYTISELCVALGVDKNTLSRWLEKADIVSKRDNYDERRKFISEDDAQKIARLHGRTLHDVSNLPTTIQGCHREIIRLRELVETLRSTRVSPIRPAAQISREPRTSQPRSRTNDDGSIPYRAAAQLATQHGANSQTSAMDWFSKFESGQAVLKEGLEQTIRYIYNYLDMHPRAGTWRECENNLECPCHSLNG
jgi:transposase-like protein